MFSRSGRESVVDHLIPEASEDRSAKRRLFFPANGRTHDLHPLVDEVKRKSISGFVRSRGRDGVHRLASPEGEIT
jgi:hypothetical protein